MKNILKHLPNSITLGNLALGVLSIICSVSGESLWAAIFIATATIPDFLDGLVARSLRVSSAVGKDLDSLADLVSFCVAPAVMIYTLQQPYETGFVAYLTILIPVFGALRLARFNNDSRQTDDFYGLTTTATGLWLASWPFLIEEPNIFSEKILISKALFTIIPIVAAVLMNAPIRLFSLKFKNLSWKANKYRFALVFVSISLILVFQFAGISLIIFAYLLLSLIRNFAE
ncbi:MAG: CDP-diacylglycerol--serine O-phosphatidyltransferase [Flavobacteriales bacterium]|nr:CDP-diacylglycerol--serine O-phosphatidyltransferase [Flavobacteriales bacterium]